MVPVQDDRPLSFLFRVLLFSMFAFPVLAAEESSGPGQLAQFPPEPHLAPPAGEGEGSDLPARQVPAAPETAPFPGNADTPDYWVVSSRRSVQHIRQTGREPWGVDVFHRRADGQFCPSSLSSLSSHLVPGLPVCIFVHGSFVRWDSQLRQAEAAYVALQSAAPTPVQMIFFTWPSDGPFTYLPGVDVSVRGRRAEFNGFHLAWLISQIPESSPVCLIGHSHGARVVFATLHLAGGGDLEGHFFPYSMGAGRRYRVIVAAAAIDHVWLTPRKRYGSALDRVECVLNFRNRHDLALTAYRLHRPFAHRPLGKTGLTPRNAARLGWNSAKLQDCDVTHLLGTAHFWPDYYSDPRIVATMVPYLTFQ